MLMRSTLILSLVCLLVGCANLNPAQAKLEQRAEREDAQATFWQQHGQSNVASRHYQAAKQLRAQKPEARYGWGEMLGDILLGALLEPAELPRVPQP